MTRRGHLLRAHTADVIAEAWGPDISSCIEEAVAALVSAYADVGQAIVEREAEFLVPHGSVDSMLLHALDDVLFTLDTSPEVPIGAVVRPVSGGYELTVQLAARNSVDATGAAPKAISRSGLEVECAPSIIRCSFLIDV